MTDTVRGEVKELISVYKEITALQKRLAKYASQSDRIPTGTYKAQTGDLKAEISGLKKKLTPLTRNIKKYIAENKKDIKSLDAENARQAKQGETLQTKFEASMMDKKEYLLEKRSLDATIKKNSKTIAALKTDEALLVQAIEATTPKAEVEVETATPPKNGASITINKKYLIGAGAAIAVVLIVFAAKFVLDTPDKKQKSATFEADAAQTEEMPVDNSITQLDKPGTIKGNNVNIRLEPNIKSPVIKQLHNGTKVTVLAEQNVSESGDALLSQTTQLTTETGKKIKLAAGKGIIILEEKEHSYLVKYAIADDKSVVGEVGKNSVKKISGDLWYQIKFQNSLTGWIYGKFVAVQQ